MDKYLHVISLNIPWPPNYGGVIDIFYKLKALHRLGVKIILHAFEYDRSQAPELTRYCEKVYYYKRKIGWRSNFSLLPYNVVSRKNLKLLNHLLEDDYPILFEGLHSCYYLSDPRLKERKKIVRTSNIEHDYYHQLSQAEKSLFKRLFLQIESWRFAKYEKQIRHASLILAISKNDAQSLQSRYPGKRVEFVPAFHPNDEVISKEGLSNFVLYHAKLSVAENEKAALYLIKKVFSQLKYTCIIAGMDPSPRLIRTAKPYAHIRIEANPSFEKMDTLIREAQIHTLITFQDTGIKLKLLNSLFSGRHVLVNSLILSGSGLDALCHRADTSQEMIDQCNKLMQTPFNQVFIKERKKLLFPAYDNLSQAKRVYDLIYGND